MKLPLDKDKYLSAWQYTEFARYVPHMHKVLRQKDGEYSGLVRISELPEYRKLYKNTGLYTSIWFYDKPDIESSVRLGPLYFDIDNEDLNISYSDTIKIYSYLVKYIPESAVLVYFTGKKGFHIECEPIALGINPSNNLPNIYRFIAGVMKDKLNLTCLDFSVYDSRRMWRLAGSRHQETGLYKNLLPPDILISDPVTIQEYCDLEQDNNVDDQVFDYKANEWFRDFTYNLEIEKERSKDFIAYFNKYGSSVFKNVEDKNKIFNKDNLLKGCPAVQRLYDQAVEKKWLDHEARLFLCSILTYSPEAITFLHEILSNCEDYNVEKSNSHINDWIKRRDLGIGGRPYTCERANSAGVGCGQCSLESKKKWIKIGNKYVESDEVSLPSPVRFAYSTFVKGGEE